MQYSLFCLRCLAISCYKYCSNKYPYNKCSQFISFLNFEYLFVSEFSTNSGISSQYIQFFLWELVSLLQSCSVIQLPNSISRFELSNSKAQQLHRNKVYTQQERICGFLGGGDDLLSLVQLWRPMDCSLLSSFTVEFPRKNTGVSSTFPFWDLLAELGLSS